MLKANRPDLANHVSKAGAVTATKGSIAALLSAIEGMKNSLPQRVDKLIVEAINEAQEATNAGVLDKAGLKIAVGLGKKYKAALSNISQLQHDLYTLQRAIDPSARASVTTADAKLSSSLRSKVNKDLIKAGLDGNGRFRKVGEAINAASGVLQKHGLEEDDVFNADRFRGDSGRATFNMAFTNIEDPFSPEQISNSMLVVQWHFFAETTKYEVLMYMS